MRASFKKHVLMIAGVVLGLFVLSAAAQLGDAPKRPDWILMQNQYAVVMGYSSRHSRPLPMLFWYADHAKTNNTGPHSKFPGFGRAEQIGGGALGDVAAIVKSLAAPVGTNLFAVLVSISYEGQEVQHFAVQSGVLDEFDKRIQAVNTKSLSFKSFVGTVYVYQEWVNERAKTNTAPKAVGP